MLQLAVRSLVRAYPDSNLSLAGANENKWKALDRRKDGQTDGECATLDAAS